MASEDRTSREMMKSGISSRFDLSLGKFMKTTWVIAGLIFLCFAGVSAGRCAEQRPYDVLRYEAEVSVDIAKGRITGVEELQFQSKAAELSDVEFDASDMSIEGVWESGVPQQFENAGGLLKVHLEQPLQKGQTRTLKFVYSAGAKRGLNFFPDHVYAAYSTSQWLVCQMHPGDKAVLNLKLNVPVGMKVVANGDLVEQHEIEGGKIQYVWQQTVPMPAYVYGFAAGAFEESTERRGALTLRYLARSPFAGDVKRAFKDTQSMFDFYEQRSGVPYPWKTYTQVLASGGVMQEMSRFTVIRESYAKEVLADETEDWLIAHELSHQWWGNSVTCADWSDFWLNEGMATFMTAAYKEKRWGRDEYDREIEIARRAYLKNRASGKDRPLAYEKPMPESQAGGYIVYDKGALILNLLRVFLGEKAFWNGIRSYTQAHFGGSVTSRDLQLAMEKASGKPLGAFFYKWVYGVAPSPLKARYSVDSGVVTVRLEQGEDVWPIPVKIAVETPAGRQSKQVVLARRSTEVKFNAPGALLSVRVDDGGNLPFRVEYERPEAMLLYQMSHEPDLAGRLEAMDRLGEYAKKSLETEGRFKNGLAELANNDPSRFVRTLAKSALGEGAK
jgi:aminopeptidase N